MVTASDYAHDARVVGNLEVLVAPKALDAHPVRFRTWLLNELARLQPDCLCIDAFPAGILGELCDLPRLDVEYWHVARLLRWNEYQRQLAGECPHFRRVFRVESLTPMHQQFLERHCDRIEDLALSDPPAELPIDAADPYWLIVHSGPAAEVAELIAYADEVRKEENTAVPLLVITSNAPDRLPAGTRVVDVYPAMPYFAAAQRIFSAAGFNVMRQTAPWRAKQRVMPMERRFDDQFARAAGGVSHTAG